MHDHRAIWQSAGHQMCLMPSGCWIISPDRVCACVVSLCLQGGLIVNNTGSYYPAVRITGMVAGQTVSFDDIEVGTSSTLQTTAMHNSWQVVD
jgi:hypothetical protein